MYPEVTAVKKEGISKMQTFKMRTVCVAVYLTLLVATAFPECISPHYRAADNLKTRAGTVRISIDLPDFAPARLVCLVQHLKERHKKWSNISLLIFSSHEAARNFRIPVGEIKSLVQKWADQLHAMYVLNRHTGEDDLTILPAGWSTPTAWATTIRFPAPANPRCRLQIDERCLLVAVRGPYYPPKALNAGISGDISLVGVATTEGIIRDVRVEKASVPSSEIGKMLVKNALESLSSWRLESGRRQDTIHIIFSYTLDPSLQHGVQSSDYDLPSKVIIRGNPASE